MLSTVSLTPGAPSIAGMWMGNSVWKRAGAYGVRRADG